MTKDDIPTIIKPVIYAVQATFPHQQDFEECRVWRKGNQCSIGEEKQNNESTGSLRPVNMSANLSSMASNQMKPECAVQGAVILAVVMATTTQHETTGIMKIVLLTKR